MCNLTYHFAYCIGLVVLASIGLLIEAPHLEPTPQIRMVLLDGLPQPATKELAHCIRDPLALPTMDTF